MKKALCKDIMLSLILIHSHTNTTAKTIPESTYAEQTSYTYIKRYVDADIHL